jgi:dihydrofolate reductase
MMRKILAAINMTIDGFCDHTAGIADEELHQHYNELLNNADTLLYGRKTYQLMESFWPTLVKTPSGNQPIDDFAVLIDNIPKIVYSRTLTSVDWKNTVLKKEVDEKELIALKEAPGKDILAGSRSMIITLSNMQLIDEYQLCIHPFLLGSGLPLFNNLEKKSRLTLTGTKVFKSGVVALYYQPVRD